MLNNITRSGEPVTRVLSFAEMLLTPASDPLAQASSPALLPKKGGHALFPAAPEASRYCPGSLTPEKISGRRKLSSYSAATRATDNLGNPRIKACIYLFVRRGRFMRIINPAASIPLQ